MGQTKNKLPYKPFHMAFPVLELEKTRYFYESILNCEIGRTTETWIDFNFFGHQITAHQNVKELEKSGQAESGSVDSKAVPCRHFGAILDWEEFDEVAQNLQDNEIEFIVDPYLRFEGEVGEQKTMFVRDPSGNALEFKSFKDHDFIFAS